MKPPIRPDFKGSTRRPHGFWLVLGVSICFLLSVSWECAAAPNGQETLDKPQWKVGLTWEVLVRQKAIVGAMDRSRQAEYVKLWQFKVERELRVDGTSAFAVAVSCKSAGCTPERYLLFFMQESLTLMRVEVYPSGWEGRKTIHWYRRSDLGPTVTALGHVPLSMPAFGRDVLSIFRYEHCINGPNGFGKQVTQKVERQGDHKLVELVSGSTRVVQKWRPGFPWPVHTSVNNDRIVAELVKDSVSESKEATAHDNGLVTPHGNDNIDSLEEFGPPREGRWWPLSATVSNLPWSRSGAAESAFRLASAVATSTPSWSGYWWPMLDTGSGDRLWDVDGPLDKYDYYERAKTGSFPQPYATTWEYQNHRTTDQKNTWWGHCNGWAAASIREPEPAVACWSEGIYFRVADKKGLITEWHNATLSDGSWGDRYYGPGDDLQDIYPYEFITVLIQYIVNQDEAVVMDLDCHEEVWNHPIYGYELTEIVRYGDEAKFLCKVYYATDSVSIDFVGTWEKIAKYEFWCTVDGSGNFVPGASSWSGSSSDNHPDFLWHPGTAHGDGNPALREQFVHKIAQAFPSDYAHIEIQHTWRGDLVVKLGAGNPANPDWVTTLTDKEGDGADNLIMDVDISAASNHLPPGSSHPWFLMVSDNAEGDVGSIQSFTITYSGSTYHANDLPVQITDGQTSYVYIGTPSSSSQARIEIQHTYRGDLIVKLGVGNPANPTWVTTVSDREGEETDDLAIDVDISGAEAYLPPGSSHPWFLEVSDHEEGDVGSIQTFSISHNGSVYSSTDPPVQIPDLQTSYAYIRPSSSSCQAHIEIQHTWRGDLVVRVGVGDPANPTWVTTVSDREGEDADDLLIDLDVCAAEAYLPPSGSLPWFLEVSDHEEGDVGSIQAFAITYNGSTYSANNLPVQIIDGQTSYSYIISSSSSSQAHIEILHTWRGDLTVNLGVGDPANPIWVTTVSDGEGEDADDIIRYVNISAAEAYLPPVSSHPWFLKVSDNAEGDVGTIQTFAITFNGSTFRSRDLPVNISDGRTCYAYIGNGPSVKAMPWIILLLY